MGRIVLAIAALLLLATAGIHAMGLPMVSGWGEGLGHREQLAICLFWVAASVSWAAVALLWGVTAWRLGPRWPPVFGGQMLAGSVALAVFGLLLLRRQGSTPTVK